MNIYVASSWRNPIQPTVVDALRKADHEVYDFKNPRPGSHGFHWKEVRVTGDTEDDGSVTPWKEWTPEQFREALHSDIAQQGFNADMSALNACEACVLVLPCGKSAHLELGQAVGAGKRTIVYMPEGLTSEQREPELMYKMCDYLCLSLDEVLGAVTNTRPLPLAGRLW